MRTILLTPTNVPDNFNEFRLRADLTGSMVEDGQTLSPTADFRPELRNPMIRYYGVVEDGNLLGWFKFARLGFILWEGHLCLDHDLRNRLGLECAQEALALHWKEHPPARIVSIANGFNRPSIYFGFALGFRIVGRIHNACVKKGRLWDRYVMEREPSAQAPQEGSYAYD
jgi:hypothetical protein